MIEAAINGALPRGIEFNGNALAIAQFKTPSSPLSDPRPTIELMRSININELRHAIPRYSNTSTSPMSALNISTLPVCVFPPPASKSLIIFGRVQRFRIVWIRTGFGRHRAILVCGSCDLPTYEMCVQEVIAGNRGFCSPNPYYRGPEFVPPRAKRKR